MNKYVYSLILMLVLYCPETAFGQDYDKVLNKVVSLYYDTESYETELSYVVYKDHYSDIKLDELTSIFCKNESDYYLKMGLIETISNKEFNLKVSHSEKLLLYTPNFNASVGHEQGPAKILESLSQFKSRTVEDLEHAWEFTYSGNTNPMNPYYKIAIQISKQDYSLLKQVFYFNKSIDPNAKLNSKDKHRLEVTTNRLQVAPKVETSKFQLDHYLTKNGNKYTVANRLKNYKVILN